LFHHRHHAVGGNRRFTRRNSRGRATARRKPHTRAVPSLRRSRSRKRTARVRRRSQRPT
jgi:hypothetical protein